MAHLMIYDPSTKEFERCGVKESLYCGSDGIPEEVMILSHYKHGDFTLQEAYTALLILNKENKID